MRPCCFWKHYLERAGPGLAQPWSKSSLTPPFPCPTSLFLPSICSLATSLSLEGSKTTADGDCSREIKRRLLLGRKVTTNLDSILKSRDIPLPTKVPLVKAMVFPVVLYGCESWTIKKTEHQRIDALQLWCWKRLLRVPWTSRRST